MWNLSCDAIAALNVLNSFIVMFGLYEFEESGNKVENEQSASSDMSFSFSEEDAETYSAFLCLDENREVFLVQKLPNN